MRFSTADNFPTRPTTPPLIGAGWFAGEPDDLPEPPEEYGRCLQCGERIVLTDGRQVAYGCPCFDGPAA